MEIPRNAIIAAVVGAGITAAVTIAVPVVGVLVGVGVYIQRFGQLEDARETEGRRSEERRLRFFSTYREPGDPIGFSNGGTTGLWSDPVECPPAHYVCRLRQRVSNPGGYESRVTAIEFSCCPLAAPAETTPSEED